MTRKWALSIFSLGLLLLEKKIPLYFLLQYNLGDSSLYNIYKPSSVKQYDTVSGQLPPRKIAPRIIDSRTIAPWMISPRMIAP